MADILLRPEQLEGPMPAVCICCGAPAIVWREKTLRDFFRVLQGGATPTGAIIRTLVNSSNVPGYRLRTPFCHQHRNEWTLQTAIFWAGIAGLPAVVILCGIVGVAIEVATKSMAGYAVLLIALAYFIAWMILVITKSTRAIRIRERGDGIIILQNVSAPFAEEWERVGQPGR